MTVATTVIHSCLHDKNAVFKSKTCVGFSIAYGCEMKCAGPTKKKAAATTRQPVIVNPLLPCIEQLYNSLEMFDNLHV